MVLNKFPERIKKIELKGKITTDKGVHEFKAGGLKEFESEAMKVLDKIDGDIG